MTSIPRCEVVILPEAGHLMMIDEPDRVGDAISAYLYRPEPKRHYSSRSGHASSPPARAASQS
jgi:hypothetical protein